MSKCKVEKKRIRQTCWACDGAGCLVCYHSGDWEESIYYHTYVGKDGKKYCIDGDTIK